jgi:hypothetical protein
METGLEYLSLPARPGAFDIVSGSSRPASKSRMFHSGTSDNLLEITAPEKTSRRNLSCETDHES